MKNILKAGATLFVVGALLAVSAPAIAVGLGMASSYAGGAALLGHTSSALWMGSFFGAFGAINAAVEPMLGGLFGGEAKAAETAAPKKTIRLTIVGAGVDAPCAHNHAEALAARREAEQAQRQLG